MLDVLAFWTVGLLVGLVALPVSFWLFRTFPDGGSGLAFGLGSILMGYAYFILRVVDVLQSGRGGAFVAFLLVATVGILVATRERRFLSTLRRVTPELLLVAGVFSTLFLAYVAFRSYSPDITGTEKPMDLLFLNAAITSPDYPPHDPWLAGEPVSYYYFGYVQAGVLTQLSGVPSSSGYNLQLAFIFAAAGTAVASVAAALGRRVLTRSRSRGAMAAAVLAVVFLLFLGTLSAPFEWAAAHGNTNTAVYEAIGLDTLLPCAPDDPDTNTCYSGPQPRTTSWYPTEFWFWWDGSRVIPSTITEFPFFSFLLGDMHPHVMAIPGTIVVVALAMATLAGRRALSLASHRRNPLPGVLYALLLGSLAFTNTWDLPTFFGLFALAVVLRNLRAEGPYRRRHLLRRKWYRRRRRRGRRPAGAPQRGHLGARPRPEVARSPRLRAVTATAGYIAPIIVVAALAYAPWYVEFRSQAAGLEPYVRNGTRPAHALLQYGPLGMFGATVTAFALREPLRGRALSVAPFTIWVVLVPLLVWALLPSSAELSPVEPDTLPTKVGLGDRIDARGAGGWVTLLALMALTWATATVALGGWLKRHPIAPVAGFATGGLLLLLGSELFLIKDIFFGAWPRQNTVFKLSYQAWVLLSIAGAVGVVAVADRLRLKPVMRIAFVTPVAVLVLTGLVYALIAVPNRASGFAPDPNIDGLAFLERGNPGEHAMLAWLLTNLDGDTVIVEATGRTWGIGGDGAPEMLKGDSDWGPGGRISSRTGLQTPIGWVPHEDQWRGLAPEWRDEFSRRQDLVDRLYTGQGDITALLTELDAEFVVVSNLERSRYPATHLPDFSRSLDLVFEQGGARVYALPQLALRGGE